MNYLVFDQMVLFWWEKIYSVFSISKII